MAVFISIEDSETEFTASRVFAALALFNQMTVPLFIFPITVPVIISAFVSTKRLTAFLDQPEVHRDFEGVKNMARILSRSDASLDEFEKDNFERRHHESVESEESSLTFYECDERCSGGGGDDGGDGEQNNFSQINSEIKSGSATFPKRKIRSSRTKLKKNNELSRATKLERNRTRQKSLSREFQFNLAPDLILKITNGTFTWENAENNFLLKIDKLEIPTGKYNKFFFLAKLRMTLNRNTRVSFKMGFSEQIFVHLCVLISVQS